MSDDPARSQRQAEFEAWQQWFRDLRDIGAVLLRLASAELQLAAGDLRRFILLSLLVLPVALLTWLGFALLLSWAAYSVTGSAGAGFAAFFLLHCIMLLVMRWLLKRYRKSMSLPVTREHLGTILEELRRAPQPTDQKNPEA